MRFVALFAGLLAGFAAYATSPSLVASGDTTPAHVSTNYTVSVGSPSASDLVVVVMACLDNTGSAQPSMTAPSGWTVENDRADGSVWAEQSVFWKVASGSEGATVNFPISGATSLECGARYWKFTGYSGSNPIDCTSLAWSGASLTIDPPSQTVAGGPLDVYVIAFANDRGDNSYSSGSDLTTNAHINAGGLSSGRTVDVSYGAYTSISSKDPGAFVDTGASPRQADAVTCVIYPTGSGGQAGLLGGSFKRLLKGKL